jgi:ketosteroid isomerase-like protein
MGDAPHPNMAKVQEVWDAVARGELADPDAFTDNIVFENGPGAGPWRVIEGKEAFFIFTMQFLPFFKGTWHQGGRCIYADDRCTISIVHETGTGPDGDAFDNMAVWITRIDDGDKIDRIWTVDLDQESVTDFWNRHQAAVTESIAS